MGGDGQWKSAFKTPGAGGREMANVDFAHCKNMKGRFEDLSSSEAPSGAGYCSYGAGEDASFDVLFCSNAAICSNPAFFPRDSAKLSSGRCEAFLGQGDAQLLHNVQQGSAAAAHGESCFALLTMC